MARSLDHRVIVVGDGPAGRALWAALRHRRVEVACVGRDVPWSATYGTWVDDVRSLPGLGDLASCLAASSPADVVTASRGRRATGRLYGAFDNERLRERLTDGQLLVADVRDIRSASNGRQRAEVTEVLTDRGSLLASLVIDARGWSAGAEVDPSIAQQTAFGVVLASRPDVGGEGNIVMDWRPAGPQALADGNPPTFLYVLGLGHGRWLAEETALAAAPAVGIDILRRRLAERLGDDVVAGALATERVRIPMQPGIRAPRGVAVPFGARAGYVHPATGYSVAASLRAADRVARAIADTVGAVGSDGAGASRGARRDTSGYDTVWRAVWPRSSRRTRILHDVGSSLLATLDPEHQDAFFARFFELEAQRWGAYLRIDSSPYEVASAMAGVFAASPWSVRRRLLGAVPRALSRRVRPGAG